MLMRIPTATLHGAVAGNRVWTEAEREVLVDLYLTNPRPSMDVMAAKLGRTKDAISTEVSRLCLRVPGAQPRKCLPCQRPFFSSWIGYRICPRCELLVMECA
ncbi:hypothetical protein [Bradyrhizobium australafricanum]|uniref:hypothetical protein n=1 Tax=Bradyrhizobium australafricanum TaxID=2821406 RepID=UPI001CE2951D|nr:hypothetical protein [Bradyrhizobium australafricanum]MCA6098147.1 hypothetical protein [Bradyrhizobium australafricanum]